MNDFFRIEEICQSALELPAAERASFLDRECGDDADFRREVESLLALENAAKSFIEVPPGDIAAEFFSNRGDRELIGRTIGNYRIVELLGAGGMGEVYAAEDVRLGRRLALKVLPREFSDSPDRKRRFEREARAASALNHPNIITIFGSETEDGVDFIVSELIEGKTLRDLISDGPLAPTLAVDIATQVADALDAAHSVGIVHRDIKPANIMIRPDGRVKVLDFGLAKLTVASTLGALAETHDRTEASRVMGTINYMSPEQALGQTLDGRSDLFSLGVCLYEMLAGETPFAGNTDAAVYDAILNKDAPFVAETNREVSPRLGRIVSRALEKKPDDRFESAAAMRDELKSFGEPVEMFVAVSEKFRSVARPVLLVLVSLVLVTISVALFFYWRPLQVAAFDPSGVAYRQITSRDGAENSPSLSSDGRFLIFASHEKGNWDIFQRNLDGEELVNLTGDSDSDDRQPTYSPDGSKIAFRSEREGGGVFVMNADGSDVRKVVGEGFFPAWSPDGKELVVSTVNFIEPLDRGGKSRLFVVDIANGNRRTIPVSEDAIQASWSPHRYRIAYWATADGGARDVKTISADGDSDVVAVTNDVAVDWNPVWSPDGNHLYFVSNRSGTMSLWRVAIDEKSGRVLGEPESVPTPTSYFQHLAFSRDGKTFAFVHSNFTANIERFDYYPETESVSSTPTSLTKGAKFVRNPSYSPDGTQIAFDAVTNKQEDIFVMKSDGTNVRQLTNDIHKDRAPTWSPDGKSIVFYSSRTGKYKGWKVNADGGGLSQLTFGDDNEFLHIWSRDGRYLVSNPDMKLPVLYSASQPFERGPAETLPDLFADGSWLMAESWSPDSSKLAAMRVSNDPTVAGIVIYNVNSRKYDIMTDFGADAFWLPDNRRLIFADVDKLYLLDSETKKTKPLTTVDGKIQLIAISPDNRAVSIAVQRLESDIWVGQTN